MGKPSFKLIATVDTLAHANTIKNSIQDELVGKDIFEEHNLSALRNDDGNFSCVAEFSFNNNIDRDSIKDWIISQVRDHQVVKNWVSKARLSWHYCTHGDKEVKSCKTTGYFEWSK